MKRILFFAFLVLFISCGSSGIEGYVGESITITAENPEETDDVDFNWVLLDQPDGSLLSSKDLKYKMAGQEMNFAPDYPGSYTFEVSISRFGDELSSQSFIPATDPETQQFNENIERLKGKRNGKRKHKGNTKGKYE